MYFNIQPKVASKLPVIRHCVQAFNKKQSSRICSQGPRSQLLEKSQCSTFFRTPSTRFSTLSQSCERWRAATPVFNNRQELHTYNSRRTFSSDFDHDRGRHRRPLKLMDFPQILYPNLFKSVRNKFFELLISGYYDKTFSIRSFIFGCIQAVSLVSSCIAEGNFDALHGLVEEEAIQEIRNAYGNLDAEQKKSIRVNPRDIITNFVYEIGMMFDDETDKRFVEITVVMKGLHGLHNKSDMWELVEQTKEIVEGKRELMFILNYRFIREFTKGVESEWTINKLNHFA